MGERINMIEIQQIARRSSQDPNERAFQADEDAGYFDSLPDGTFVVYNDGKLIFAEFSRDQWEAIATVQSSGVLENDTGAYFGQVRTLITHRTPGGSIDRRD